MLFARNWAALRTALVQGAALLTVLAAVSAAGLQAGRWRVDAQGTLRVRGRLGVRLDRSLKASQRAALTIERPLLYRLTGASRVVLYPAGQKRTLTLLLRDSGEYPRRRKPQMVGIRGSSHPFTSFSFTRVNRLRLLISV